MGPDGTVQRQHRALRDSNKHLFGRVPPFRVRARGAAARCALRLSGRAAWVGDPTPGRTPRTPGENHWCPAARQEHPTRCAPPGARLGSVRVCSRARRRRAAPYGRTYALDAPRLIRRQRGHARRAHALGQGAAPERSPPRAQRPKGSPARRARWRHPRAGPCLRTGSGRGCQEGGRARPPRCCAARSLCPSGWAPAAQLFLSGCLPILKFFFFSVKDHEKSQCRPYSGAHSLAFWLNARRKTYNSCFEGISR